MPASPTYRSCRTPEANSATAIQAEFHLSSVKLYFTNPSTDNSGRIFSETYTVIGSLHPNSSPEVLSSVSFKREDRNSELACGAEEAKVEVHSDAGDHHLTTTDSAHALVYIIQQDEFHVVAGGFPTKYGLDGRWFGGNRNNSYFYASVEPGEHHLCAEWGVKFKHYMTLVSAARVVLQPGKSYFFRARVVFFSMWGQGERSTTLEPVDPQEGTRLIANSAFSTTNVK